MRTLKFAPHLIPPIIAGKKTTTWRLFDDKYIETDDTISFMNAETKEIFGKGKITWVSIKTLESIGEEDYRGHERFTSFDEMLKTYQNYYGDKVTPQSVVKVIQFEFVPQEE